MRIAELSGRSGVPVPTIKYYLREGLLPPGESTQRNQARYDERHLQRLRLVRVLLDVGGLPIAAIRDLLADLDRPDPNLHHALGRALKSASPQPDAEPVDADLALAESEVDALVERRGWRVAAPRPPAAGSPRSWRRSGGSGWATRRRRSTAMRPPSRPSRRWTWSWSAAANRRRWSTAR